MDLPCLYVIHDLNHAARCADNLVLVKDGECFLTRERETFEDLFNKQIIPDYLQ
mgnify:CR=1 FL=1